MVFPLEAERSVASDVKGVALRRSIFGLVDRSAGVLLHWPASKCSPVKTPKVRQYSLTGIGQYWISNRVWVGAGMGFGENDVEVGRLTVRSGTSFALAAEAGVELWQRGRFALDLRGRYTRLTKFKSDKTSIGIGLTWY